MFANCFANDFVRPSGRFALSLRFVANAEKFSSVGIALNAARRTFGRFHAGTLLCHDIRLPINLTPPEINIAVLYFKKINIPLTPRLPPDAATPPEYAHPHE